MYLIFAVSSQTLHLRYCCKNTGKQSLRKQFFSPVIMTNITCDKNAYLCVSHVLSPFMPSCIEMSEISESDETALLRFTFRNSMKSTDCHI